MSYEVVYHRLGKSSQEIPEQSHLTPYRNYNTMADKKSCSVESHWSGEYLQNNKRLLLK